MKSISTTRWFRGPARLAFLVTFLLPHVAIAGDWPQILGPDRTGIARDERLNFKWPGGKPKVLWKRAAGDGVAGIAVHHGRAFLFHRIGNEEVVEAMDATTGKVIWKQAFDTSYRAEVPTAGDGPRCVPVIHGESVFVYGPAGDLRSLAVSDGDVQWFRPLHKEYDAPHGYFGAGSTPIVEADKLLVNVGGDRAGAGIVALDLKSGKTVWAATNEQASYSAPTAATIKQVRHVIFATRLNVLSVDPDTGDVRFRFPFGQRGPTVNAATPLIIDGHVFVTASYGIGSVLARIGPKSTQQVWSSHEMASQYPTPIHRDGYLYGIDGRQDVGVASLCCLDLKTGKKTWAKPQFGMASLIDAGEKLLVMKTDGTLVIVEPDPKEYREVASAPVLDAASVRDPALALPALANGLLYVRDSQELRCIDLRANP